MKKILFATDGSESSLKAVDKVVELANQGEKEVTVLSVAEVLHIYKIPMVSQDPEFKSFNSAIEKTAQDAIDKTVDALKAKGVEPKTILGMGNPADFICQAAADGSFDWVVLGSRGLGGIKGLLMGSVANKVAQCANTNVVIVK
jgi:nucleotide-binding universal stress UspA family protein